METAGRRLMWHGIFLFLLGLLTGFAETHVANVRMGLAAHLEGVMNGIFLVAVGGMWPHVKLAPTLYGTYLNWVITLLAAIFGTGALSPITAPGRSGLPWQESMVTAGFMSVGIAIVLASLLMLWGLRSKVSE